MARRFAVVITTINVPRLLGDYLMDFRAHGREAEVIVIGDEQTPREAASHVDDLRRRGFAVEFFDIAKQREYLTRFDGLDQLLPTRSIQRRNVGYLIAYEHRADVIVSLDDDNFLVHPDYLAGHDHVGERRALPSAAASDGWVNTCDWLEAKPPRRFYHRGYPVSRRWTTTPIEMSIREARVAVNAGMWLRDPDVDTVTRFEEPFEVVAWRGEASHIALARGVHCPFNSQNTAALAELLPFLYLTVPGRGLHGFRNALRNFRYDDIWMSYFALLAMDRMDDAFSFGAPLVEQRRNQHGLLQDLDRELIPMFLTESLVAMLARIELRANGYLEMHAELLDALTAEIGREPSLAAPERQFFDDVVAGMRCWHAACRVLMR
jgi:hypothetical protein